MGALKNTEKTKYSDWVMASSLKPVQTSQTTDGVGFVLPSQTSVEF